MSALDIAIISTGGAIAFSVISVVATAWAERRRRSRHQSPDALQAPSATKDDRAYGVNPPDIGPRPPAGGGDQVNPIIVGPPDEPFRLSPPPSPTQPGAAADVTSAAESPDQWLPPEGEAPSRSVQLPAAEEPPRLSLPPVSPGDELPAGGGAPPPGPAPFPRPAPPRPPTPPSPPDRSGPRYANASLADAANGKLWARDQAIWPEALLHLRLDIGPLSETSQVSEPVPFPDDRLPRGDLQIDVVVSSSSFRVSRGLDEVPTDSSAEDSFLLPGDGGPAGTPEGGSTLTFVLQAPAETGLAMARITYYFRGAVVQSHLLSAQVGGETTGDGEPWWIVTDYTVAAVLATASAIPDRPRVAVILNGDDTDHQIYLRTRGTDSVKAQSAAANLPPKIGDATRAFREALASPSVAPVASNQSKAQLVTALRKLAPLGRKMYSALFSLMPDVLLGLGDGTTSVVLHVARPSGVSLSVPWAMLYTIPLYKPIQQMPLCPLIDKWDGHSPLVTGQPMSCPQSQAVSHTSDLLCPFGFLGYRFDIEQLNSTEQPVVSISAPPGSRVVVAETTYQVNKKALQDHITAITKAVARLNGVGTDEASDKNKLKQLISRDLPLVYFFCHGDRPDPDGPDTYLGIGNNEHVSPEDLVGWIQEAYVTQQLRVWNQIRPLVFINACHSAEIDPQALFNYIDVFVGGGNAAGVIGTEVKVAQPLAMEFADIFFDQLLSPGATVATAIRHARLGFLAKGNIFGLNYTPYCWADLTIAP